MNTKLKSMITIVGSSLLLAGCCTTHLPTKWEYKILETKSGIGEKALNELAREGWVLVSESVYSDTAIHTFTLKRPLK